jgi:hypothetical protein
MVPSSGIIRAEMINVCSQDGLPRILVYKQNVPRSAIEPSALARSGAFEFGCYKVNILFTQVLVNRQ